jgi:flagellar biosynthesis/type III secretory pathway protein FliH
MLKIKLRKPMIPKIQIPIEKLTSYKIGFSKGKREGKREGKMEGIKEGLKEAILLDFDTKFGNGESKIKNMKKELKKLLDRAEDLKKLKKIKSFILSASDPDEFIKKTKEYLKTK